MSRQPPVQPGYQRSAAAAAAALASDHGRRVHELPWLYLDSVGQEYGPVPGWTMREWLTLGRFPVGRDLRVRLPEWERHLPLHQLFPDLNTAFVLPPAWPGLYADDELQCEDDEESPSSAAARLRMASARRRAGREAPEPGGQIAAAATASSSSSGLQAEGDGAAGRGAGFGSCPDAGGRWVPLPRLWMAGMSVQQRPEALPSGQEGQLLPPPGPVPGQQQWWVPLQPPQEGPPLWEDEASFPALPAQQGGGPPSYTSTGAGSSGDVTYHPHV